MTPSKEETIQRILEAQPPYTAPMKLMTETYDAALIQSAAKVAELESRERALREAHDVETLNLADYAKRFFDLFDQYRNAWLREMGGVIRPKHWEIDGFVLRMRDIYEKAQLVDRMKQIMIKELKARPKGSAESMFDAIFKMLAENGHDKIPTN